MEDIEKKIQADAKTPQGLYGKAVRAAREKMPVIIKGLQGYFKKDFIVGLDIGTSSIKAAQFTKDQDGLSLVKCDLKEIKRPVDNAPQKEETAAALKELCGDIDLKKSTVIACINCPRTAIKSVTVPYMPVSELREAVKLEAKGYFPFPISESLLDFEILGDSVENDVRKYRLAVATSPRKTIYEHLSILDSAGVKPASFILPPHALRELFKRSQSKKDDADCFLDIGDHYTELVILNEGNPVFSRKIPVAGNDLTKAMTGVLVSDKGKIELSLDEAEKLKLEVGIPAQGESRMIDDKISTTQILSMLRPLLEQMVSEIDRCFDYYRQTGGDAKIASLVLLGGGALLKGLPEFLADELEMEVKVGDPSAGLAVKSGAIKDSASQQTPRLAAAIGAALSEGKGLNLLPPEIKEETGRTFKRAGVQAVVTAAVLIMALVYIGMKIQLASFHNRVAAARMELSSLSSQQGRLKTQNLINKVLAGEPYWDDVLKELSHTVSGDLYLTRLNMKEGLIKIKGIILSGDAEAALSNFIITLEKGIFKNVKLVTSRDFKEKGRTEFELSCQPD